MTDNIKKIINDLYKMNEERKEYIDSIDIDEILDDIFEEQPKTKEYAHIFICENETVANEVNVLPKTVSAVIGNLVIVKRLDAFYEDKNSVYITVDKVKYDIPRKYSYSFSFVE